MSAATDYDPAQDSTGGVPSLDNVVTLEVIGDWRDGTWTCPCGCLQLSKTSRFCMGHDAKLREILVRAHLAGVNVDYVVHINTDGEYRGGTRRSAVDIARDHGWEDRILEAQKKKARAIEDLIDWADRHGADVRKEGVAVIAAAPHAIRAVTTLGKTLTIKRKETK